MLRHELPPGYRRSDARQVAPDLEDEIIEERAESADKDRMLPKSEVWKREILQFTSSKPNGQIAYADEGIQTLSGVKLQLSDWSGTHKDHKVLEDLITSLYVSNTLEKKGITDDELSEVYEITVKGYKLAGA